MTMKKAILSLAMFLAIGSITFAGTALPASATIGPEESGVYYYEDACDGTIYTANDYIREGRYASVEGTKHFLALRNAPSYNDNNIIGTLHNGDVVQVFDHYNGDYVWVYAETLGYCGWVNANYLAY